MSEYNLRPARDYPSHPGKILQEDMLPELGLSIGQAATKLGISRSAFFRLLNGKSGISTEMAVRLELAGVSTARFWLALQARFDEAQVRRRNLQVQPLAA